ncbi:hypothetical protein MUG84_02055 [Paenibacillus sp. KQZ6P-2]|uniref:Uncharacterized protein n=1 Tax=Paenibacillus mangrovi TaxID=2931978 RepID=A0A9X1WKF4_9BACL|nr:hypothetical protein [Paenibacillus mangrovi]MCJ8010524.1 hypothetical protein [Paenibacillus mangrovi]
MIVNIGYVLVVLILAAAGILAWKNLMIILDQRKVNGEMPAASSYTVQVTRLSEAEEQENMTPLFEASYQEQQGTVHVCLCRMNGTISELELDHAVQIMDHTCSELADKGTVIEMLSHPEAATNEEESVALLHLEQKLRDK